MRTIFAIAMLALLCAVAEAPAEVLYGADGAQGNDQTKLYVLDPAGGSVLVTVGTIGYAVTGLAVHPATGVLYGATSNKDQTAPRSLITIDKATGRGVPVGAFSIPVACGQPAGLGDLTFTSDGKLYGSSTCDANLYQVDLTTGRATRVGAPNSDLPAIGVGLAASASNTLYLASGSDGDILRIVNATTGVVSDGPQMDSTEFLPISALAFNAAGALFGSRLNNFDSPATADLITIDTITGHVTVIGPTVDRLDAIVFDPAGTPPPPPTVALAASVLPSSRSVRTGATATAFASVLATGTGTATGCRIDPIGTHPFVFGFQTTDPATNAPMGLPNMPVSIAAGGLQTFVISFETNDIMPPTDVRLSFDCANTVPAAVIPGVNTLLLSISDDPVADIVALAATLNGDGIVNIPGTTGTGVFAVATVNVGAEAPIMVSADTGNVALPVVITLCQTNPASGLCISAIAPEVNAVIGAGQTPTFAVFVHGTGSVAFAPAVNRVFVRFQDGGGDVRGATSVAVRTQ